MKANDSILRVAGVATASLMIGWAANASALSPPPPQPDDELLPLLYQTLGGEEWGNSEGWLDPEVHWCDWHGIECGEEYFPGYFYFDRLELPDNNLRGQMTEQLAELLFDYVPPREVIDLSGNAISGELAFYPRHTERVDLSDNELDGPLPPLGGDWALDGDQELLLARNDFAGSIPQSWSEVRIWRLNLSDNRLTGGIEYVVGAASKYVFLTGNPLDEELGRYVLSSAVTPRGQSNIRGGIDVCYTGLTVSDPDVEQWLAEHHATSANYSGCLNRERIEVDATISGSWYDPERSGEGISLMMLDNGNPLVYQFGFDTEGRQQWLFEVGASGQQFMQWEWLLETQGAFNSGLRFDDFDRPFLRGVANFRMDRLGPDSAHLHRNYYDLSSCGSWEPSDPDGPPPAQPCPPQLLTDRLDYQRLSELAGTACENQTEIQQYSGAWYNPERSGEGLVVEMLPSGRAVIYWFTYQPGDSNRQAWMIAEGEVRTDFNVALPTLIPDAAIERAETFQPIGGVYGPDFDSSDIELVEWGEISLNFYSAGARFSWESNDPQFGSGGYDLERLAKPMLADCN